MIKKHFVDGEWKVCRAKEGNCPKGHDGKEPIHSRDPEEQKKISEQWGKDNYGLTSSLKASSPIKNKAFKGDDNNSREKKAAINRKNMVVTKEDGEFLVNGVPLSEMSTAKQISAAGKTDNHELLETLIHDNDKLIATTAANNPHFDPEKLDSLVRDPKESIFVYEAVAKSNHVSEDTLSFLARNDDDSVRKAVAGNKNTTSETLALLAKDNNLSVRKAVAGNKNTTSETLALLAKDKVSFTREAVAGNKNTTVEILSILMKDKDPYVRMAVAGNKNTTVEILALLAKDESHYVRQDVAYHKNTTVDILALMAKDSDPRVRRAAIYAPVNWER